MILIAHRGNISGANLELENTIDQFMYAISLGFDVEADIWVIDETMYLGHDEPKYLLSEQDFNSIYKHTWFHCKNLESINYFIKHFPNCNYFWHQLDDFTLTSNNKIWTYPGMQVVENSIIVDLETTDTKDYEKAYGVCSDKVLLLRPTS